MLERRFEQLLLEPSNLAPSCDEMKVVGVFNPGAIDLRDEVVVMARVAEAPVETRAGWVGLPRWRPDGAGIKIDWIKESDLVFVDPRVVELKRDGLTRLTFTSHLRVFRFRLDLSIASKGTQDTSRFVPNSSFETYGVEDPRVTTLDGVHYVTYVAVSEHGACAALARTTDFVKFERLGIIFPPENKDVALFPERIQGRYMALHRPNPRMHFTQPEVWVAVSDNLLDWGGHRPLFGAGPSDAAWSWQTGRVGGGCPPVRTPRGWLAVYHGNDEQAGSASQEVGVYSAGALLLDIDDPARVVARTLEPVLAPQADFERAGFLPNVVFPTALLDRGENWLVIYGAADTSIGAVEINKAELDAALV